MLKVIVAGAAGRMGGRIVHMIHQNPNTTLVGAFERADHPDVDRDAGLVAGVGELSVEIAPSLEAVQEQGEVLIDFTAPEATLAHMKEGVSRGLAMVIGTTAIKGEMLEELESLAQKTQCVFAPNMSVGVNVMFKVAEEMARILGSDYDMEILETHHRLKKDAPSGTAMRLAQILAEAVGRDLEKVGVYERKGMIGQRTDEEIGIQTWRAGDITGEHTVMFGGIGERMELIHRAHNRDNFARGAVRAALWVVNQPKGLYDMQDVLGLR
ncbi:MAG: 4-hydroxy-tetrahydrodipicolinate reductase [Desulfobacteraceae bacterium]